jgi:lysozyme family protein
MVIKHQRQAGFKAIAQRILAHKDRYEEVEKLTGVAWPIIAMLHIRESDGYFDTYLGNGQSLHHVTTIVPRGRGPFPSWEVGAVDALKLDGLADVKDWRLEKMLFWAESFNGWGYAGKGLPSPYIWGGTNIQKPGKYVSDGKWNGRVMDPQPGCAPILKTLMSMDSTIQPVRET